MLLKKVSEMASLEAKFTIGNEEVFSRRGKPGADRTGTDLEFIELALELGKRLGSDVTKDVETRGEIGYELYSLRLNNGDILVTKRIETREIRVNVNSTNGGLDVRYAVWLEDYVREHFNTSLRYVELNS